MRMAPTTVSTMRPTGGPCGVGGGGSVHWVIGLRPRYKRRGSAVEAPGAVVVAQSVVVSAYDLDRPAGITLQQEDDVTDRARLVVIPVGHERVEDEMTLRPPRLPFRVRSAQRVATFVPAHPRDVADAIGTERGDDVVRAAVVERLGVRGDCGTDAFDHFRVAAHPKPMSTTGRSSGFTLISRSAGRSCSYGSAARKPSIVRWKFEICPSMFSERRMYSNALACRPFCCRGRFEKSCAGMGGQRGSSLSHGSGDSGGSRSVASGNRVSDQISISVSSGPSGRNRYDDALLYIGNTK